MAIDLDTLNTTYADLAGPLVNTAITDVPLFDHLQQKAKLTQEGGTYVERVFAGTSPARGVGLVSGDELLNMTRTTVTKQIKVEKYKVVCAINIPKKALETNTGNLAVIRLIKSYPELVMNGFTQDMEKYLLTGNSADLVFSTAHLSGFNTLNGQFASGRVTGTENGLLDFDDPSSQTDSVQSVSKSTAYGYYNQYVSISSWSADNGMKKLRSLYRACAHYAGKANSGPDFIVMDDDTFANFEESRSANIRIRMLTDKIEDNNLLSNTLSLANVRSSLSLDRSLFSGNAANGVGYFLNTDWWQFVVTVPPKLTPFVDRVADQDVVTSIFSFHGQLVCTKLIAQGCFDGGAV